MQGIYIFEDFCSGKIWGAFAEAAWGGLAFVGDEAGP
jgi:hypothetical protein